ncbi:MAG: PDZ domain-containing protein [Deltaproteobacteria bacterium]|nr:PDZ domain-containing protein [Deltaproteobacteria bacterium]
MKKIDIVAREIYRPLLFYKAIIDRNLFKTGMEAGEKKKSNNVNLDEIKPTELNLKLWGTVTGPAAFAFAVIEETKNRTQSLYRTGDTIQNATVKLILREKVVLNVNGRDEILEIEQLDTKSKRRVSAISSRSRGDVKPLRAQKITLRRSQIQSAMENVSDLMSQVKIRPHFENGQPDGLTLSSLKPRSIFRKMGLRNGDIITGIDGSPIQTVDDALKFYESLTSSSNVSLQMKRRGREKTIEYKIK